MALACLGLTLAYNGLAWTSQGLAGAFQHLVWATLGQAQASGGEQMDGWMEGRRPRKNSPVWNQVIDPYGAAAPLNTTLNQISRWSNGYR